MAGPSVGFRFAEEPTPTHERKDRQNGLPGMTGHCHLGRRTANCQIVQERKHVAVMNSDTRPGARELEDQDVFFDSSERTMRESERPVGWALRRRAWWRSQRHTRHEPAFSAIDGSREESEPIELKEQRRAARLRIVGVGTTPKSGVELGLAAVNAREQFERSDFDRAFHPDLVSGSAKEDTPVARFGAHVGRERVRPVNRIRGHARISTR